MAIKIKKNGFWIDTGIKLDEELNKSNQAADAAITGNLITDLEERTNKLVFGDSNATSIDETIERLSTEIQPIERGGTGSNNGAQGLNDLLLEGQTVLSNHQYGESFPNLENSKSYTLFLKNKSKGIEDIPDNTIFGFLNKAYPIGSIYTTVKADDPSVLFGGTWEKIKDRILIGFGDTYTESTQNVSKLSVVDSGHTIPGAMTVNMWKRTGMFELPDLTVAIYDDSFPLQWNSLEVAEIKNARNSSGMIKISNLIPTIEKMKKAFIDINGEIFTYSSHFGSERDYSTVYEYTNGTDNFYIQVVKEGYSNLNKTLEPGIYVENVFEKYGIDKNCQIYTKIYDDTFPLQWNSKMVSEAENQKNLGYVKISNLTPTLEEMERTVLTVGDKVFTYEKGVLNNIGATCLYRNGYDRIHIDIVANTDSALVPYETGMYVYDVYEESGTIADCTLSIVEQPDIPDTPTGIYDDEFPIEWNSADITGNTTLSYNDAAFRVSSLSPSAEEMETATFTLHAASEGETADLDFIYITSMPNDFGHTIVMFGNEQIGLTFYFVVVPEGDETEESGLYAYDVNEIITQLDGCTVSFTLSLAQSGVYDDTFPIEWAMADVANNTMAMFPAGGGIPKISNLVLSADELSALSGVASVNGNDYVLTFEGLSEHEGVSMIGMNTDNIYAGLYSVPNEAVGVDLDGIIFPESGIYLMFVQMTDYPDEAFTFSLNLAQSATHYLYGHEAEATVSYNGVVLPDIESVWTDKQTYPYAVVCDVDGVEAMLAIMSFEVQCVDSIFVAKESGSATLFVWVEGESAWGEVGTTSITAGNVTVELPPTWSNHNILNTDGSVYLAASDPVKSYPDADVIIDGVGYVGAVLPALPETDLQYKVVWRVNSSYCRLLVSSEMPYAVTTNTGDYLHFHATWGYCDNNPKQYQWTELVRLNGSHTGYDLSEVLWTNFDLYHEDGTLICKGSEPIYVENLPYVIATLYDGEVTTADNGSGIFVSEKLTSENAAKLTNTNAYRVTIDGVTTIEEVGGSVSQYYLGNPYLYYPTSYEDNGGAWCIRTTYTYSTKAYSYLLYTRTAGTYQLKLESVRE